MSTLVKSLSPSGPPLSLLPHDWYFSTQHSQKQVIYLFSVTPTVGSNLLHWMTKWLIFSKRVTMTLSQNIRSWLQPWSHNLVSDRNESSRPLPHTTCQYLIILGSANCPEWSTFLDKNWLSLQLSPWGCNHNCSNWTFSKYYMYPHSRIWNSFWGEDELRKEKVDERISILN